MKSDQINFCDYYIMNKLIENEKYLKEIKSIFVLTRKIFLFQ